MSSETVDEKAERLLAAGKLKVLRVSAAAELQRARVVAECEGDNGRYTLGFDAVAQEWRCTCPARRRCAHIAALQLVTKGTE